jgi:hypothetical protein
MVTELEEVTEAAEFKASALSKRKPEPRRV